MPFKLKPKPTVKIMSENQPFFAQRSIQPLSFNAEHAKSIPQKVFNQIVHQKNRRNYPKDFERISSGIL